ncbi:MAG: restriction endonuclease [Verrucomicrobia bacterium]|nr:MAG: restriction endonuclease [Verrucomicrobiota bacterium]
MNEGATTLEPQVLPQPNRLYTYDELVAEFPESNQPCELWDGEIILSPSPSFDHQEIVLRFYRRLHAWVSDHKLGKVTTAPMDMVLSPHRVVQPDVAFIAQARLGIIGRVLNGPADLVAEVISLGRRNRDRIEKRDLYEQYGVKEYWIVDPEAQTVEVLSLESGRYRLHMRSAGDQIASSRLLSGFEMKAAEVFFGP